MDWCEVGEACTNPEAVHLSAHSWFSVDARFFTSSKFASLYLHELSEVVNFMVIEEFFSTLATNTMLKEAGFVAWDFPLEKLGKIFGSLKTMTEMTYNTSSSNYVK